jgi:hypothetical protein
MGIYICTRKRRPEVVNMSQNEKIYEVVDILIILI